MQELLADEIAVRARAPHQLGDLGSDALLLVERELHRLDDIRELRPRRGDTGYRDL